jgi:dTDP-4-amino-4,6-dideoxygalactose transaminase
MHLQPVFSTSGSHIYKGIKQVTARVAGGKISEHFFDQGLCLPSGTAMTQADLDRIIAVIFNTGSRKGAKKNCEQ